MVPKGTSRDLVSELKSSAVSFAHALIDGLDIALSDVALEQLAAREAASESVLCLALLKCQLFLI